MTSIRTWEKTKECGCLCYNIHGIRRHNAVIYTDISFKTKFHFTRMLAAISIVGREEGCELDKTLLFVVRIIVSGACRLR